MAASGAAPVDKTVPGRVAPAGKSPPRGRGAPLAGAARSRSGAAAAAAPVSPTPVGHDVDEPPAGPGKRPYDAQGSMVDILAVATAEFADKGLSGARIDEIAAATRTSKRMIYYHYGSKEGLYLAVLEESYRRIRAIESTLSLEDLAPEAALRELVGFTFDYQHDNEDFVRLVMNENMQRGKFIAKSRTIQRLNSPVVEAIRKVYDRGVAASVFRAGIDPLDLHLSISALCFFNVANRHTLASIFLDEASAAATLRLRRAHVIEMIDRFVQPSRDERRVTA